MTCCGQKRAQWMREAHAQRGSATAPLVSSLVRPAPPATRLFEYTGGSTLIVRGAATGATYRFGGAGVRIAVALADSFALLAEQDLRLVT